MLIFLLSEVRLVNLCTASGFLLFSSICQIIFGGLGFSIASPWCAFKGLVVEIVLFETGKGRLAKSELSTVIDNVLKGRVRSDRRHVRLGLGIV